MDSPERTHQGGLVFVAHGRLFYFRSYKKLNSNARKAYLGDVRG